MTFLVMSWDDICHQSAQYKQTELNLVLFESVLYKELSPSKGAFPHVPADGVNWGHWISVSGGSVMEPAERGFSLSSTPCLAEAQITHR